MQPARNWMKLYTTEQVACQCPRVEEDVQLFERGWLQAAPHACGRVGASDIAS